jgi:tetratricopeptide (TPR) repeat protein
MKRWGWLLALALAVPAGAGDKDKDKDKDKKKPPAKPAEQAESVAGDSLKQAEDKAAAGDIEGATELLRQAASIPGATGEPSLRLGMLLEGKSQLDEAMDAYKAASVMLAGPMKGEALGRLAAIQETRGMAEAAATAEAAVAADPKGAWPNIALSRARARQGNGAAAAMLADKAEAAGGGAAASAAKGYAEEARGDLAAAETAYRAAVAADPGSIQAVVGLARVLRKTDRAAEAGPMLQKVIDASPGAVEAYKESARVKIAMGRAADAVDDAATAAALAEHDADAQRLMRQAMVARALDTIRKGQVDLAVEDLTKLRDKEPEQADVRVGLARALIAKRQTDAAVAELEKAIALDPASAEAQYQLGYVRYVLKHDAAGALGPYEKATAADPSNLEYRTGLGAVLSDLKQYDRAVTELGKVTEAPGYKRAEAWIYLGAAHFGAKHYKDAIVALDKAAAAAPDNAQAEAYLAWSYFALKDAPNFKKHAGKAKALGHKEPKLLQYLTRIEAGEPIK